MKGDLERQASSFLSESKESKGEWAQRQLIAFIKMLKGSKIEAGTVRNYYKVVKGFCDLNKKFFYRHRMGTG